MNLKSRPRALASLLAIAMLVAWCLPANRAAGQATPLSSDAVAQLVADFKSDARGPFQAIRWFCPDGSVIGARERCAEPGGIQHALHKDVVTRLQQRNGVYLGQILAGTANEAFLDEGRFLSRVKQYQIEKFLIGIDDGWILRKARFYRGAYQAEDEEAWGKQFLEWALSRNDLAQSHFFLMREATRDIPHEAADNLVQRIRSESREISDAYPAFLDIRVKIHGQPGASDTLLVAGFARDHTRKMPPSLLPKLEQLQIDLRRQFRSDGSAELRKFAGRLPAGSNIASQVRGLDFGQMHASDQVRALALLMFDIRERVSQGSIRGKERLALIDLSVAVENVLFLRAGEWRPATLRETVDKAVALGRAATGSGLLEFWEWAELEKQLALNRDSRTVRLERFRDAVQATRQGVEWGVGMVTASFGDAVDLFAGFEPLAAGFLDDRMRASVLLPLGETAASLSDQLATLSGLTNEVMGLRQASGMRGLNAGVAVGKLEVVAGAADHLDFKTDKIYVLSKAPAELKPVAGIATVSEGNAVSHVQLLARNLGIPNAVLTPELLRALRSMDGERVFYAVSPGGVVRIKAAVDMTPEERLLVEQRQRTEARIKVPTNRLDLTSLQLTALADLRAEDSGRTCGPKAANLGQLSSLFPGRVAPGFIIPFGVFRQHMDQRMPGTQRSYWDFLRETFESAAAARKAGASEQTADQQVLARLAELREAIERMPLKAELIAELRSRFTAVLGGRMGTVPVFVRSDTNMEDLKDFTGAGLNLTVPNVVTEDAIIQAIRRVWASPYRERGYGWRQKYLSNPEDVYPSLLILRSVAVDKSGVLITAGINSGSAAETNVAFNRGVGGAVDGQAAESYLIRGDGSRVLLSPAREVYYTALPSEGGVTRRRTSFDRRILTNDDLDSLAMVARQIRTKLPGTPGIETNGPFDVELGFLNELVNLFQARPFVDNKAAAATTYLAAMDARGRTRKTVDLDSTMP